MAETVSHTIKPIERVNLQLVLDRWMASDPEPKGLVGYVVGSFFSNAEIAEGITVSLPTAKTHVGRILTKLHARDRAKLVAVAYETGLIRPGHQP